MSGKAGISRGIGAGEAGPACAAGRALPADAGATRRTVEAEQLTGAAGPTLAGVTARATAATGTAETAETGDAPVAAAAADSTGSTAAA